MDEQSHIASRNIPSKNEISSALGAFSPLERLVFIAALAVAALIALGLLYKINEHFMVSVPMEGGTLSEGVVGTPRFVNPLLASSDADRDLTALVYRGLMKKDEHGAIVPDIADNYTVSGDGLTYTFTLKAATFDDGKALTSDDVAFTVKSAQDATLKSAERVKWEGVMVKAPDEKTVVFTLKQPFAPFLENTTLGILPKHIWSKVTYDAWIYSMYNTKSVVGDGAYSVKKVSETSAGVPEYYELAKVDNAPVPSPLIDAIDLHFYTNESALIAAYKSGAIDTLGGIDPENAAALETSGARILTAPLPRVFGLFLNQSQAKIFTDANVRYAIAFAIDRHAVIESVLKGYGTQAAGPIPANSNLLGDTPATADDGAPDVARAKKFLEKDGWKLGDDGIYTKQVTKKDTERLSFEIATNDTPELAKAADIIAENLRAAGIEAIPKVYETGSLNQDIIRPRKFQALFFGEVVSSQSDLYAFWHSSQIKDPGLNIAGYANRKVDKLLETGLATLDPLKEAATYAAFLHEIDTDTPAVFVYSPSYIYAVRSSLPGITLGRVTAPEDRFSGINTWYLATDRVWKIFTK